MTRTQTHSQGYLKINVTSQDRTSVAQWLVDSLTHGGRSTADAAITDVSLRQHRQRNLHEGRLLKAGHRQHFAEELEEASASLVARPVRELLDSLAGEFGLNWVDISRMLRVSVPALRKWRLSANDPSGENHRRLANLAAFLTVFDKAGAGAPGQWLNVPFDVDFTVRPRDIYSDELAPWLLEYAVAGGDFRELLQAADPEWRTKWARHFETVSLDDRTVTLVTRESVSEMKS